MPPSSVVDLGNLYTIVVAGLDDHDGGKDGKNKPTTHNHVDDDDQPTIDKISLEPLRVVE